MKIYTAYFINRTAVDEDDLWSYSMEESVYHDTILHKWVLDNGIKFLGFSIFFTKAQEHLRLVFLLKYS